MSWIKSMDTETATTDSTTNVFGLQNMVYSYPDVDEVQMSGELLKRREFSTLTTGTEQRIIRPGEYFNYQEIGRRYMVPYDRLLCILEPGTGKTCYDLAISERFHLINEWIDTTIQLRNAYRRAYFITTSNLLIDEFNYQFICRCTDGRYNVDKLKYDVNDTGRTLTITRERDRYYSVYTYSNLSKDLSMYIGEDGTINVNAVREKFDNCIFFLDEAHYFRNNYSAKRTSDKNTIEDTYRRVYQLLESLTNYKLVISTATPMIDKTSDFVPLINLLTIGDADLPPLNENEDYGRLPNYQFLEKYFNGRVAYIKALPIGVRVVYQGLDLHITKGHSTKVVPLLMEPYQSERYNNLLINNPNGYASGIYIQPRLTGTFTHDESKTMTKELLAKKVEIRESYYTDLRENLGDYSVKFKYIMDYIEANDRAGIKKLYFIYWDLLEGGLVNLANTFVAYGYDRYDGSRGIFETEVVRGGKRVTSKVSSYCAATNTAGERILTPFSKNFPKKKRFTMLSGTTQNVNKRRIKQAFTHPDNRYGEYIQVIIGSAVTRLGLNFENVTEMFFIGPSWNYGDFYQAMFRILRAQSHLDLIADKRRALEEKIERGEPVTEEDQDLTIDVNIHRLCAIPRYIPEVEVQNEDGSVSYWLDIDGIDLSYDDYYSQNVQLRNDLMSYLLNNTRNWKVHGLTPAIDVEMYIVGENKEIDIRRVLRYMKQNAIDCPMNRERNMTGQPGSLSCDFTDCEYTCIGTKNVSVEEVGSITDSYSALYLGPKMELIVSYILYKLRDEHYVSWIDIYNNMGVDPNVVKYNALAHRFDIMGTMSSDPEIIEFNLFSRLAHKLYGTVMIDRMGLPYIVDMNDGGILLRRKRLIKTLPEQIEYTTVDVPIVETGALHNLNRDLNSLFLQLNDNIEVTVQILQEVKTGSREIVATDKQRILEKAYTMYINGELSDELREQLFDTYGYYMVQTEKKELRSAGRELVEYTLPEQTAYLHFFFNNINTYIVNTLTRSIPATWVYFIRIYDEDNAIWRNITDMERRMYLSAVNQQIQSTVSQYGDIYGYRNIVDYLFRISTPIADRDTVASRLEDPDDIRRQPRGTFCQSFDRPPKVIQTIHAVDPDFYQHIEKYLSISIKRPLDVDTLDYRKTANQYMRMLLDDRYNPYSFSMEQLEIYIDEYESDQLPDLLGGQSVLDNIESELRTFAVIQLNFPEGSVAKLCEGIQMEEFLKDHDRWFYM